MKTTATVLTLIFLGGTLLSGCGANQTTNASSANSQPTPSSKQVSVKLTPSPHPTQKPSPSPTPTPIATPAPVFKPVVRGIYATGNSIGGSRFQRLLQLINQTELNAIVVDVKEDNGFMTFKSTTPKLQSLATMMNYIRDPQAAVNTLRTNRIYPIARIVVFKDTSLSRKHPEWSFRNPDGSVWRNGRGESFVNPYVKEVWDYNIEVAKEAARLGFQEIQFDYVRFPEGFEKRANTLKYVTDSRTRTQAVTEFVEYAKAQLSPLGVEVSVDIFGYAAAVPAAEGIGQDFNLISSNVDVICPMVYPSHYSTGWYGSNVPDAAPYATIDGAMKDTLEKLSTLGDTKPTIRPWIQDFTASWIPGHIRYGKREVEAQIKAMYDNGIYEFLLWNAGNTYTQQVNYDLK
jgi:hypothetical protein